ADLPGDVKIESTESQSVYSIAQPHLLIQNVTWAQPPPPSPPPKDWFTIIVEFLQKPEVQLLIIISLSAIVLVSGIYIMRRRFVRRKAIAPEGMTIDELIKEIEDMKKKLKGEEESKG
ncbi:MAG: hypothetical protein QXM25_01895, partial [Nitrososphaerales archaeon]